MTSRDFETRLSRHNQATIAAITNGRTSVAKRRMEAYPRFALAFLEETEAQGIRFPYENAINASYLDGPAAFEIVKYAHRAILAAIRSDDVALITTGAYLPLDFLQGSITHKDFLFYLEILKVYPNILKLAYELESTSTRSSIIDLSWQPLREFSQWFSTSYSNRGALQDISAEYALEVLWCLVELMRLMLGQRDFQTLSRLSEAVEQISSHISKPFGSNHMSDTERTKLTKGRSRLWLSFAADITATLSSTNRDLIPLGYAIELRRLLRPVEATFPNMESLTECYVDSLSISLHEPHWRMWIWGGAADRPHWFESSRALTRAYPPAECPVDHRRRKRQSSALVGIWAVTQRV